MPGMFQPTYIFCQKHHNELITNICCDKSCLEPLCPSCIDDHITYHTNLKQKPEVNF